MTDLLRIFWLNLDYKIKEASNIFIVGHNSPDFDSIASCMGMYYLVNYLNKEAYIVVNDEASKLEPGVKKIIDDNFLNYNFINRNDVLKLVDDNSLLIVCDTNKKELVSLADDLDKFKSTVCIDHHDVGEDSINFDLSNITPTSSSTCEIVTSLLREKNVKFDSNVANYLLAGISLDTRRFKFNTTSYTHDVAEFLIDNGADIDYVNNLFLEEFESFCRISNLIINGTIIKKYSESQLSPIQVSFTLNRNQPNAIYLKEDYAKAADKMMKFIGIDAAFALGFVEDGVIHISGRSGKRVNIAKILERINGGGTAQTGGARIVADDIFKVEEELMDNVQYGISDTENVAFTPQVIKIKQIKRYKK